MCRSSEFVDNKQDVTYIGNNGTLILFLILDVPCDAFPVAVKSDTDQLSFGVHDRTAGVATGSVGIGDKVYGHFPVGSGVCTEVFVVVEFF